MGLHDLIKPTADDADEIDEQFIKDRFGTILPGTLTVRASTQRERIVRMAQYYVWLSMHRDTKPSAARKRAMSKVENEFGDSDEYEDADRTKLLNTVYALYEGRAEGEDAVEQFEADLEELALVYEGHEEAA
ncbi:MAG: hypothetical protein SV186_04930 [Candidatus Nanohaloarchaea archaeon]|nr:hypothetical protein [Candidatus Nanohaloarchaea archaeon]